MASNPKVSYWLEEIEAAKKRESDFRRIGQEVYDIYSGDDSRDTPDEPSAERARVPFNILFSNTETIFPALYSAIPRPIVERRYKDNDVLGKHSSEAAQRLLEFLLDTNIEGYETFDTTMKTVTMDALLPGRGMTMVKYDAEVSSDAETGEPDYTKSELVCCATKPWNRILFGYAKSWNNVPWIAIEDFIDKPEATRLFGASMANKLVYTERETERDREHENTHELESEERHQGQRKTTTLYQVWEKEHRKVMYFSTTYQEEMLKEEDDPYELTGFFPTPKPLYFIEKPHDLRPTAMYTIYKAQAYELNRLTMRIRKVTEAIKARGVYDGNLGAELEQLMQGDDNELIPAENASTLASEKGLGNAIWMMPISDLIVVLRELQQAREQVKQTIYEITGISDIIRGASKASETLGAQQIKTTWGTLRLKNKQKEVARYAKDLLRQMLELAASKFSEETWAKMTSLPFLTTMQVQQLTNVVQLSQMSGQPVDPSIQQQLSQPKWSDILGLLKDDLQRAYRIDIETNSTVEADATEDHKNITELLTAMGQYLNGVAPLIDKGVMPFGAAQSMLLAIARRFTFGREIEDDILAMQQPPPQDDGKAAMMQVKEGQLQLQAAHAKHEADMQVAQLQMRVKELEAMDRLRQEEMRLQLKKIEIDQEGAELQLAKSVAQEQLSMRDNVFQNKVHTDQKIKSIEGQSKKRESQLVKEADSKLTQGVSSLQGTIEKLAQMQAELLANVVQQSEQMENRVGAIIQAVTAPRTRKAIRGKDGRIEAVEESVA